MATVNYTLTHIGSSRVIVEWSGMVFGDTATPFDAAAYRLEGTHLYHDTTSDTIAGQLASSNESGVPAHPAVTPSSDVNSGVHSQMYSVQIPQQARWFYPIVIANGTGNVSASLIFKEASNG